jgi:hypothetical protein
VRLNDRPTNSQAVKQWIQTGTALTKNAGPAWNKRKVWNNVQQNNYLPDGDLCQMQQN